MSEHNEQKHPQRFRGTTGRLTESQERRLGSARSQQSRQMRQIISGADIRPPNRSTGRYPAPSPVLTQPQLFYSAALGVLLALGLLLWLLFGMEVASIMFFLFALGLLGGWLAF